MDARSLLQEQLAGSQQMIKYSLGDISDQDARRMPNPMLSPIIWQVGHLANVNAAFLARAGVTAKIPDNYSALFKGGSGGQAAYPPLEEVVRVLDDTHGALMAAVAEADLEAANEGPRGLWKNLGGMFAFVNAHRWYHVGKITSLRALLEKPRLFG
ncbi:MAG TPA: DinB family protein [bacterium]|nr:DinB family protein [bacterium]